MKRLLPWLLFGVSLLGNLFFIAGYWYADRVAAELRAAPESRVERLAERLRLDASQRQALRRTRVALVAEARAFARARKERLQGFWRVLAETEVEHRQWFETKLGRLGEEELAYRLRVVDSLRAFLAELERDQREAFLRLLARRNFFSFLEGQARP